MSGLDLSTIELKTILEFGVDDFFCTKKRVTALITEVLRERERADEAERGVALAKSELEMERARVKTIQAAAPAKPTYVDGVRHADPPRTTTGADGFQRPIILE